MKFQPGDRVKFLNEKGGGVVKRIIDSATVEVLIDEGFDIPVRISELIKAEMEGRDKVEGEVKVEVEVEVEVEEQGSAGNASQMLRNPGSKASGVYLVFRPQEQKFLSGGYSDVLVVNRTSQDLLYNIFLKKEGRFFGVDYGSIGPNAFAVVDTCTPEEIRKWAEGQAQLMFHTERVDQPVSPVEANFRVKISKLAYAENYQEISLLEGKVFFVELHLLNAEERDNPVEPKQKTAAADEIIHRYKTSDLEAEIDLHIHLLADNTAGMDAGQMMQLQLGTLRQTLDSAIRCNYKKLVYIHGVGAGILKIELRKLLESYDCLEFYDASIAKYGIGATEVLIYGSKK